MLISLIELPSKSRLQLWNIQLDSSAIASKWSIYTACRIVSGNSRPQNPRKEWCIPNLPTPTIDLASRLETSETQGKRCRKMHQNQMSWEISTIFSGLPNWLHQVHPKNHQSPVPRAQSPSRQAWSRHLPALIAGVLDAGLICRCKL